MPATNAPVILIFGLLAIDINGRSVALDGREIALTAAEFDLVVFLATL